MSDDTAMLQALEAILFVSDEPLNPVILAQALSTDRRTVERLCEELSSMLEQRGAGVVLRNIAGGWQLATHPDAAPVVEQFVLSSRHSRMTKASLETLAIVTYKQPVTRHQVSAIRGVNSDGVLNSLVDRGLIHEVGREDVPGRPLLYGTTPEFLERMGLPSLSALPSLAPLLDEALEAQEESETQEAVASAASEGPNTDTAEEAPTPASDPELSEDGS